MIGGEHQRPNTRVQRTRSSPSAHRSPLTRYPLGDTKSLGWLMVGIVLVVSCRREASMVRAPAAEPSVTQAPPPQLTPTAIIYRVGGDVTAPIPMARIRPDVPEECKTATVIGLFIFEATITETGDVVDVKTLKGPEVKPPCPALETACKRAILASKYKPAIRGGKPVSVSLTTTVLFHPDGR